MCTCKMSFRVQPVAVDEMRVLHTKTRRPFVHPGDKLLLASADFFSHGHTGVIGACHGDAFEHRIHSLDLPGFQINLASAHGSRIFRYRYFILRLEPSVRKSVKDQQHGHDLGHACRMAGRILILFIDHFSGGSFHQHGRRGGDLHGRRPGLPGIFLPFLRHFLRINNIGCKEIQRQNKKT